MNWQANDYKTFQLDLQYMVTLFSYLSPMDITSGLTKMEGRRRRGRELVSLSLPKGS